MGEDDYMSTSSEMQPGSQDSGKQWRFTILMNGIHNQESSSAAEGNKYLIAFLSSLLGIVLFSNSHTIIGPVRAVADGILVLAIIGAYWLFHDATRRGNAYTVQDVLDQNFDKLLAAYEISRRAKTTRNKAWNCVLLLWLGGYLVAVIGGMVWQAIGKH